MTHEEELIGLLDWVGPDTTESNDTLSKQLTAVEAAFQKHDLKGKVVRIFRAPQVNCFDFTVENIGDPDVLQELASVLSKHTRMVLPIPGRRECRLELPNGARAFVSAGELFRSSTWLDQRATLPLMLGKGLEGEVAIMDLADAPHLLIAGEQEGGMNLLMQQFLFSLMFRNTPEELKLILVDFKDSEFRLFDGLPYLQFPVADSIEATSQVFQWLNQEINRRYKVLRAAGYKTIREFQAKNPGAMPCIVLFINELADLMMIARKQVETWLAIICGKGRAAGIHLVTGTAWTDRTLTEFIGTAWTNRKVLSEIQANFATRIALQMGDANSSRVFLAGSGDAAALVGCGDMLYRRWHGLTLERVQAGYATPQECARVIERLKSMYGNQPSKPSSDHDTTCRDELVQTIFDILTERMDFDDDLMGSTAAEIADAVMKSLDKAAADTQEPEESQAQSEKQDALLKAVQAILDGRCTTACVQQKLGIGYNKACAIIESLEDYGIVSPPPDDGPRTLLVKSVEEARQVILMTDSTSII